MLRYSESFFFGTGTTIASTYMMASLGGVERSCCSGKRRERERDRHGAEADRARVDVHPSVAAEAVEDPSADRRAGSHAEAGDHGGGAEHRAEDLLPEVLAREDGVERHHAPVGEAKHRGDRVELAELGSRDERESGERLDREPGD